MTGELRTLSNIFRFWLFIFWHSNGDGNHFVSKTELPLYQCSFPSPMY